MPIQLKTIDVPLLGGLNEKGDPWLDPHSQKLLNIRYDRSGSLTKRRGLTALTSSNARYGGGTPPTPEGLATYGNELVRWGAGDLDSFTKSTSTTDWTYRGRIPTCSLSQKVVSAVTGTLSHADFAYAAGHRAFIYLDSAGLPYVEIFKDNLDTPIVRRRLCSSSQAFDAKVVGFEPSDDTNPSFFVFAWRLNGSLVGVVYNVQTNTFGADVTMFTALNTTTNQQIFDMCPADFSGGSIIAIAEDASGTNCLRLKTFQISVNTLTLNDNGIVGSGVTDYNVHKNLTAMSVSYGGSDTGIYLFISRTTATAFTRLVRADYPIGLANFYVDMDTAGSSAIAVGRLSSTETALVWRAAVSDTYESTLCETRYQRTSFTLLSGIAKAYTTPRKIMRFDPQSRPFISNSRVYLFGAYGSQNGASLYAASHVLVDLMAYDSSTAADQKPLIVAATPPYVAWRNILATDHGISNIANARGVAAIVYGDGLKLSSRTQIVNYSFDFAAPTKRQTREGSGVLAFSGGEPSLYDGDTLAEVGFLSVPPAPLVVNHSSGVGNHLLANKTYTYRYLYEWIDAAGNRHQGPPSDATAYATGGSDESTDVTMGCLGVTNKTPYPYTAKNVYLVLYRTEANGSNFNRHTPLTLPSANKNDMTASSITVRDNTADGDITSNPLLYTQTSIPSMDMPPSANVIHVHKNAMFYADTPGGDIWVSLPLVDGQAPAFGLDIRIDPFEGGTVTGLSTLDDILIVFKSDSLWALSGEPPANDGSSTLSAPQRISGTVGCIDKRSIVITDMGVVFASRYGFYLLSRSRTLIPIGKWVSESSKPSAEQFYVTPTYYGAVPVPYADAVRFLGTAGVGHAFVLDTFQSTQEAPVWSIDSYPNALVGACIWSGRYTGIQADGHVMQEWDSMHDRLHDGLPAWISYTYQSPWIHLGGVQGYQRAKRALVVGRRVGDNVPGLSVHVHFDYQETTYAQTSTFDADTLISYAMDERTQVEIPFSRQKTESVRITVQDTENTSDRDSHIILTGLAVVVGLKPRSYPVSQGVRKVD